MFSYYDYLPPLIADLVETYVSFGLRLIPEVGQYPLLKQSLQTPPLPQLSSLSSQIWAWILTFHHKIFETVLARPLMTGVQTLHTQLSTLPPKERIELVNIVLFCLAMNAIVSMIQMHTKERHDRLREQVSQEAVAAFLAGDLQFSGPELTVQEKDEIRRRMAHFLSS